MCKIMSSKWITTKGSSDSIQLSLHHMPFIIPLVSLPVVSLSPSVRSNASKKKRTSNVMNN